MFNKKNNTNVKIDQLIRGKRKTIALEITRDAQLIVRVPNRSSLDIINKIINSKIDWIRKKLGEAKANLETNPIKSLSKEEEKYYRKKAKQIIPERVKMYAEKWDLSFKKVKITSAKKRWGSCTFHGNLNFSWRLILAPVDIIDYVIIHELAHLVEKNHAKSFWNLVEKMMPDYKVKRKWLKQNGHRL